MKRGGMLVLALCASAAVLVVVERRWDATVGDEPLLSLVAVPARLTGWIAPEPECMDDEPPCVLRGWMPQIREWDESRERTIVRAGRVTIHDAAVIVNGDLEREAVASVLDGANPGLLRCYDAVLKYVPGYSSRLEFRLHVGTTGAVTSVDGRPGIPGEPYVGACFPTVLRTLRFPEPESGEATVQFALTLEPLLPADHQQ